MSLLGAVCRINSNGPDMTVDAVVGERLHVVWFVAGEFKTAVVGPRSILLREPVIAPSASATANAAIKAAYEAALVELEAMKAAHGPIDALNPPAVDSVWELSVGNKYHPFTISGTGDEVRFRADGVPFTIPLRTFWSAVKTGEIRTSRRQDDIV